MPEVQHRLILPTRLGVISFHAQLTGPQLARGDVTLRALPLRPKLPKGMQTEVCRVVLLQVRAGVAVQSVRFSAHPETAATGSPCSGEALFAQEWTDGRNLLVMGTEDDAALLRRYPVAGPRDSGCNGMSPQAMVLCLSPPVPLVAPSFHFIVAENPDPEPVDLSAWFAVDQAHADLLVPGGPQV